MVMDLLFKGESWPGQEMRFLCVLSVSENGSAFISAALLLEGEKPIRQIDNGSRSGVSLGLLCSLVAEKTLRHDFAINGAR